MGVLRSSLVGVPKRNAQLATHTANDTFRSREIEKMASTFKMELLSVINIGIYITVQI